jgi:hypothetical protein
MIHCPVKQTAESDLSLTRALLLKVEKLLEF